MADKLHRPKTDDPEGRHSGDALHDLNPHPAAGQNFGLAGPHPEKDRPLNAHDVKEAHRILHDFHDDVLRQIPILPIGSRLEAEAAYLDLRDPDRREFHARAGMEAGEQNLYIPKREVDYQLWNRLLGVTTPERIGEGGFSNS